ncbi:choice-of-anchor X domain-containing protein [Corallococcus sp. EGB]|uniref:choice-of-anchor X domain-containing protein n=1 Tax=Corallococcus sp. EGB TaxID=1521117 RepID=UPI001CBDF08E|nr:choice-of-anchor X domain-containing protein [Corallococcus sp. EGB]
MTRDRGPLSSTSRLRHCRWLLALVPLVLVGGAFFWWQGSEGAAAPEGAQESASAPASASREAAAGRGGAALMAEPAAPSLLSPEAREREARRELWQKRLERAKRSLESYEAATRYPPESRPSREHPDQMELAEPERTRPLSPKAAEDGTSDVQLRLKQDKVFVVGDESVLFTVACEDARRAPRPCEVVSALAHEADHLTDGGGAPGMPVTFVDSGQGGDAVAGDGVLTGRFQPSKQGFALFSGTLRVVIRVRSGSLEDSAFFDVLYTPAPPATFTGKVREVLENGSLDLYLAVQVRKAGRYVVAGRLDDEGGVPFAVLSFNEELQEGTQEVKLNVFGKMIWDDKPTFPLTLRDVEGFLLKEMGDPDRELMATLRGPVHTTREYALQQFSDAEWRSPERDRYKTELEKDVMEAQKQLDAALMDTPAP